MITVDCVWCGTAVSVYPSRLESKNICCSRECAAELKKSMRTTNCACFICKKDFYIKPSQLSKRNSNGQATCSKECFAEATKLRMSGEGNHQYGLRGEDNSSFKSGFKISSYGYLLVQNPGHPKVWADGYMPLHRLIVEEELIETQQYEFLESNNTRLVLSSEYDVHHIDGNKLNNSLKNLAVLYKAEHKSLHGKENYLTREIDVLGRLQPTIKIKSGNVTKTNYFDAGTDVIANEEILIPVGQSVLVATGLILDIPKGQVGLLWSRSGLSAKFNIEVGAGCIDSGYHGEILVKLYNHGNNTYKVSIGDKIAQLLILDINLNPYKKVDEFDEVTERNTNGFGSTGK